MHTFGRRRVTRAHIAHQRYHPYSSRRRGPYIDEDDFIGKTRLLLQKRETVRLPSPPGNFSLLLGIFHRLSVVMKCKHCDVKLELLASDHMDDDFHSDKYEPFEEEETDDDGMRRLFFVFVSRQPCSFLPRGDIVCLLIHSHVISLNCWGF